MRPSASLLPCLLLLLLPGSVYGGEDDDLEPLEDEDEEDEDDVIREGEDAEEDTDEDEDADHSEPSEPSKPSEPSEPLDLEDEDEDEIDLDAEDGAPPEIFEDWTDAELFQRVLIVPLLGETSESAGIGDLLEGFLATALDNSAHFETFLLDEVPAVEDVEARLYYEGCPPGQELGCQFVIGERAEVDRVVSGRVTVQSDERYRVVVTILGVVGAELEFTYALDLAAGEEDLLPRTVELALDRLRREELLEPLRDAEARADRRRRAVAQARSDDEKDVVQRMQLDVDEDVLARYEEERRARERTRVTTEDLAEQKGIEGVDTEWDEIGITEGQYLSWRNSNMPLERWRWRWSGHRLMVLGSVAIGFSAGATALRYYGGYLLSDNLSSVVDSYAWQRSSGGSSPNLAASLGVGILRNLDFEVSLFWSRSTVHVKLATGSALPDGSGGWVADPSNRPASEWAQQTLDTVGGDLMFRYSILVMPIVRPTIGLGAFWQQYPNLYNDPRVDDDIESPTPSIPSRFQTFKRLTDLGPQIEAGVALDFNRFVGLFVRVPVAILVSPGRMQTSGEFPPSVIVNAADPEKAPFGIVRVLLGVQGRLGGMPVKIQERDDVDDIQID